MAGKSVGTVVVVGRVGAGKSELVRKLVLNDDRSGSRGLPEVSSGLGPCTRKAAAYMFPGERRISQCRLIDTKGFEGTKQEDAEAIRDLAKKVDNLKTIVGVVYVLSDRMDSSERRICDFLFNTLFHDVPASRTLVVRTKVTDWATYDAESEKEYLQEQGNIPGKILDASWVAIDLQSTDYRARTILENILTLFSSCETTLQLSNKLDAALEYLSGGNHVAEANDSSPGASAQTNDQTERIDLMERRINGATSQTQEQRKKMDLMEERINGTTSQTQEQRKKIELLEERLNAAIIEIEEQKKKMVLVARHFVGEISQLKEQKEVEEKSEGQVVEVPNPHLKENHDQAQNLEQQPDVKSVAQVQEETQRRLLEIEEEKAKAAIAHAEARASIQVSNMAISVIEEQTAMMTGRPVFRYRF